MVRPEQRSICWKRSGTPEKSMHLSRQRLFTQTLGRYCWWRKISFGRFACLVPVIEINLHNITMSVFINRKCLQNLIMWSGKKQIISIFIDKEGFHWLNFVLRVKAAGKVPWSFHEYQNVPHVIDSQRGTSFGQRMRLKYNREYGDMGFQKIFDSPKGFCWYWN